MCFLVNTPPFSQSILPPEDKIQLETAVAK